MFSVKQASSCCYLHYSSYKYSSPHQPFLLLFHTLEVVMSPQKFEVVMSPLRNHKSCYSDFPKILWLLNWVPWLLNKYLLTENYTISPNNDFIIIYLETQCEISSTIETLTCSKRTRVFIQSLFFFPGKFQNRESRSKMFCFWLIWFEWIHCNI